MVSFLAVANAGDLSSTYVSYAPQAAVHKTLAYAAPVTKAIYQQPAYVSKAIYEPEAAHYNNYHSYTPAYGHDAYAHHSKVLAAPQPQYIHKYNAEYVADAPHYKTVSAGYPVASSYPVASNYPVLKSYAAPAVAYEKTYAAPAYAYEKTYAAPAVAYEKTYAAPVAYAAHAHSPAVAYTKSYAAPVVSTPVHAAAPIVAPAVVKSVPYVAGHAPHITKSVYPSIVKSYEPDYHHYGAAPAIVKTAAVSYSPATAVSHTSFESVNAHYGW